MSKLIVTRGVPASGKSTWAKAWVAEDPDHRARVNRDDIRFMLFEKYYDVDEQAVNANEKAAVRALLDAGKDVVVDATNLRAKFAKQWYNFGVPVEWRDFPISFSEAIYRDDYRSSILRERGVGRDVIEGFFKSFSINRGTGKLPDPPVAPEAAVAPVFEPVEFIPGLPKAIIVDIDGTLAHMTNRGPYDTSKYADDAIDPVIRELVNYLAHDYIILVTSGRSENFRKVTSDWLDKHHVQFDRLIMRPADDPNGRDDIVKNYLYETRIKGFYNVVLSIDDRDRVVDMWRAKGIKTLQAERGDF